MSEGFRAISRVHTYASFTFESAPASKCIQREERFSGVRQISPTLEDSSRFAISGAHLAPLAISADSHGSTAWMTCSSHVFRPVATALLLSPDQLMKSCNWA